MFGILSKSKSIIDAEQEDWIVQQYDWLVDHIGFPDEPVPLILPTTDFFKNISDEGHNRAVRIFEEVKSLMGMSEWQCELRPQEQDINPHVDDFLVVQNAPTSPLGTFGVDEKKEVIVITYNPRELNNPSSLIATFSHELSHYILLTNDTERLGSAEDEEFLTDLLSIASGFGLFLANARFNFSQHGDAISQGWQYSGAGYLTEGEILYALSMFNQRYRHNSDRLKKYLKPNLFKLLKKSEKYLANGK